MKNKYLNGKGKGEYLYDYSHDILMFKFKDRDYDKSLEFDDNDLTLDIDTEGFITGITIYEASKVFKINKTALNNIKEWIFSSKINDKKVIVQLKFAPVLRNKSVMYSQDFIRETSENVNNCEAVCSV